MMIGSLRQVVDYLKQNVTKGYTMDSLKWALIRQGYSRSMVLRAINIANKELAEVAPKLIEKPTIKYEVVDEYDNPIKTKKSWWKSLFG